MKRWTSATKGTVASSATALTSSYVTHGGVIACGGYDQLSLLIAYTKGDETQLDFKIQFSNTSDFATAFERINVSTDSTGVSDCLDNVFKRTTTGNIEVPIAIRFPYCRLQLKATGGTPTGTFIASYILTNIQR